MAPKWKIYFCGSIRAGRGDADLYGRIVEKLGQYGTVLTPFVASKTTTAMGTIEGDAKTDKEIYDRDMRLLKECHAVVAEVTQPSLGVGYEIGQAHSMGKKILCLYRPQPDKLLSAMIRGAESESSFQARDYQEDKLPEILEEFFCKVVGRSERNNSLDWNSYEPM